MVGMGGILGGRGQQLHVTAGVHNREPVSGPQVIPPDAQGIPVAIDVAVADSAEIKAGEQRIDQRRRTGATA